MSSQIKVVNIKNDEPYDLYIGRANKWMNLPQSKWANPFVMSNEGQRPEVLRKYEAYIRKNEKLMSELYELDGKRLACFCWPKNCHGDILRKLREEQLT